MFACSSSTFVRPGQIEPIVKIMDSLYRWLKILRRSFCYETNKLALYLGIVKYHGREIWKYSIHVPSCIWHDTTRWKYLDQLLNFVSSKRRVSLDLISTIFSDKSHCTSKTSAIMKNKFTIGLTRTFYTYYSSWRYIWLEVERVLTTSESSNSPTWEEFINIDQN